MTNFLILSNIILWLAVMVLAVAVFALVRQIGVLYERIAPAGALMIGNRLVPGATAPEITATDVRSGHAITIGGARSSRSQLVFFVAPDCPVCKTLLPVLCSVQKSEDAWLDIVLASDDSDTALERCIEENNLHRLPFINSGEVGRAYGVSKLPYGALIDERGALVSMGLINSREQLESLFEAKERRVGTIQEYLENQRVQQFDPVKEYADEMAG